MSDSFLAAATARAQSALAGSSGKVGFSTGAPAAAAPPAAAPATVGRGRQRRFTKENMLGMSHMLSGKDLEGVRIKIFTATLTCARSEKADLARFAYEGESIPSERTDTRLPGGRLRHGHGEIKYESGNSYVGQWTNDKRDGAGTYTYSCGDKYEGQWKAGMYEGAGKYTSADSDEYEGQWHADKPHGRGRYLYRDTGDVYEGEWVNGMRQGRGKYVFGSGDVQEGLFEAGHLVDS